MFFLVCHAFLEDSIGFVLDLLCCLKWASTEGSMQGFPVLSKRHKNLLLNFFKHRVQGDRFYLTFHGISREFGYIALIMQVVFQIRILHVLVGLGMWLLSFSWGWGFSEDSNIIFGLTLTDSER